MVLVDKFAAVILTLFISVSVWFLSWLGVFVAADGWMYDHLVRLGVQNRSPAEHVLLVDTGPEYWRVEPAEWQQATDALLDLGAVTTVFTFAPPVSDAFPANEKMARHLIVAESPGNMEVVDDFRKLGIETAVLDLPQADAGIYRTAKELADGRPGLALAAVQRLVSADHVQSRSEKRINFHAGRDWIPRVSLQRLLQQGLIPELVAGRIVLLGPLHGDGFPGLHTPVHQGEGPISLTEYQAYFIETLLLNNDVYSFPPLVLFVLLFAVAGICVIVYQHMSFVMAARTTLLMLALYVLTSWLFLHYAALWLPLVELLLGQILLFSAAVRHQQLVSEEQLHRVVADAESWTRGHLIPQGFYEGDEHWTQVANLVDQTLDLRRLIFLDRIEDDHRVHEIKALRCDIDDIDERRRDFERRPYSTAIEEGGPLKLNKDYLKSSGEVAEVQYLVPLVFAGDVVGFWAFGVDPERLEKRDEFEQMVQRFASQIAELLYHRQQCQREAHAEGRALNRYLRLEGGGETHRRVGYALKSIEKRRSLLDRVLGGLDTGIVVYDLFGRVMTVNGAMEAIARDYQLAIYDMTALDFLTHLTDMNARQARQVLNYLTLQSQSRRIPVTLGDKQNQKHLLMMKPLGHDSVVNVNSEATAFDISGLLFEIIDVSEISALCGMKESLVQRYVWDMRNDLESIQMGTDLLQSEKTGAEQRRRVTDIVREKLQSLALMLSRVEKDIKTSVQTIDREGYPLDTMSRLETILRDIDAAATEHGIRFVVDIPSFFTLALAQPAEFDRLVYSILTILLNDAAVDTEIRIKVWLEEDSVRYRFTNTGFGLPDDDLQRFLRATGHAVSEDFRVLHDCISVLQCWGGGLEASSAVGKGFCFEFGLPTVV